MGQNDFYIDKTSHTFADALAAFGLARVLEEVLSRANGGGDVRLEDGGGYYRLTTDPPIEEAWLDEERVTGDPFYLGAPIVRTQKNRAKMPDDLLPGIYVDYEDVRDRRNEFNEVLYSLPMEARRAHFVGKKEHPALQSLPDPPHPDWEIFRVLNPAGLIGYNNLMVQWWQAQRALPDLLRLLFSMTATTPNDIDGTKAKWNELAKAKGLNGSSQASASQIFNPGQGKGQNRANANSLSMGNVDNFWLLEWLKAVGFYESALTRLLKGSKDRKTYVVAPHHVSLKAHAKIMREFRDKMAFSEPATRFDILVALRYTRAFLEYCEQNQAQNLLAQLTGIVSPRDAISGFYVAFYKNLGNSAATMNLSFINLPGWMNVGIAENIAAYQALLEEHERIVRQLDESHSDAFDLLQCYRDFIAGNDLTAFFEFTTAYGGYVIGQRERGKYAPQFTEENLRRLFIAMEEKKLGPILENQGFQRIAYAIRQSTVVAQYRKQQGDRRYDVRYGLGQDLARKANYPGDFVTALSDFLHRYNAENAQVMEARSGPYRRSIQTSDIEDILKLIDEYGSQLICNLLIAYGYARTPREPGVGDQTGATSDDESSFVETEETDQQ